MRSSRLPAPWCLALLLAAASPARAQEAASGFAVDRLMLSPAGAGWAGLDALDLHGGWGGAIGLTLGYAHRPLRVDDGATRLDVVEHQAVADVAMAFTVWRLRIALDLPVPLRTSGESGTAGGYRFTAPSLDLASHPDTIADPRLELDARLLGAPHGRLRLGVGGALFFPGGPRDDYVSDGSFRGLLKVMAAGDAGMLTWAAHLGVHLRPLDERSIPGSPRGSELLFAGAAGARLPVSPSRGLSLVIGAELLGASAFTSFLAGEGTALEALLSTRLEGTGHEAASFRVRLAGGAGLWTHLGAPEWRLLMGIELFR